MASSVSGLLYFILLLPLSCYCRELLEILYPFGSQYGDKELTDVHQKIERIPLPFRLPFYGGVYNYTMLCYAYGYISFATPPEKEGIPPQYPNPTYPIGRDHAFIAPLYTDSNVNLKQWSDIQGKIYHRILVKGKAAYTEKDKLIQEETDKFLNRTEVDIHSGMIGTHDFISQYALVITWGNVTFIGADTQNPTHKPPMNTFQLILITDEVRTFAIFNYAEINWINFQASSTTTTGQPALVGFNGGNGTGFWPFIPFSGNNKLEQIDDKTNVDYKGRYIFRIDEEVQSAGCIEDNEIVSGIAYSSPDSGTMLGGTVVNVSGPCFDPRHNIRCRFEDTEVVGSYINKTRAKCIQPMMKTIGWIPLEISIDGGTTYYYIGRYFVAAHHRAYTGVYLEDRLSWQKYDISLLSLKWDPYNLTWDSQHRVDIGIWGYREENNKAIWQHLDTIISGEINDGDYRFDPRALQKVGGDNYLRFEMGALRINVTGREQTEGHLWSPLIPLGWYYKSQWEYYWGNDWPTDMCERWYKKDKKMRSFMGDLVDCPCTLLDAKDDEGGWIPLSDCDIDGSKNCLNHEGAIHCVTSSAPSFEGSGQECCYDQKGLLFTKEDHSNGGSVYRAHDMGVYPYKFAPKLPSLSHYYHDVIPFLLCCDWSETCHRYKRQRESDDCVGYRYPGIAALYGDPHLFTYDGYAYTFNGMGEYVLTKAIGYHRLALQARFEQSQNNTWGFINGTVTTAVAMKENDSSVVEVQSRPEHMKWRYKLKILVDGKPIYFDRPHLKFQQFRGVSVWVPYMTLNQSKVVIRFNSGAGVRVEESYANLHVVSWVPFVFLNTTMGLFGNYSNYTADDFKPPTINDAIGLSTDQMHIYNNFGLLWRRTDDVKETGASLFTYGFNKGSHSYFTATFKPEFEEPLELPPNATFGKAEIDIACGSRNPQIFSECRYDYLVTGSRELAIGTRDFKKIFHELYRRMSIRKKPCGSLPTPKNGHKEINSYYAGSRVRFSCDEGYRLYGLYEWECTQWGRWTYGGWWWGDKISCWSEYEIRLWTAKVASGSIIGILAPFVLLAICYTVAKRRSQKGVHKTQSPGGYKMNEKLKKSEIERKSHESET